MSNANQNVPLATPGLYRLFFSTKWAGCEGKSHTLDEIYALPGGPAAILETFGWPKLEQVQPGARQYLDEFINGNGERKAKFAKVMQEKRSAEASALRRGGRRGPTHAERERQREFGF